MTCDRSHMSPSVDARAVTMPSGRFAQLALICRGHINRLLTCLFVYPFYFAQCSRDAVGSQPLHCPCSSRPMDVTRPSAQQDIHDDSVVFSVNGEEFATHDFRMYRFKVSATTVRLQRLSMTLSTTATSAARRHKALAGREVSKATAA
jgi:hypothetical protein